MTLRYGVTKSEKLYPNENSRARLDLRQENRAPRANGGDKSDCKTEKTAALHCRFCPY